MKKSSKVKNGILLAMVIACLVAIIGGTYARYSSGGTATAAGEIAKWHVTLNDEDISSQSKTVNVTAAKVPGVSNDNVSNGKIAPGQTLAASVEVDPAGSEVAVDYVLDIGTIDTTGFNTNSKIAVSNVVATVGGTAAQVAKSNGSYICYESLEDVLANKPVVFSVYVSWADGNNAADTANGLNATNVVVPMNITARQHIESDGYISSVNQLDTLISSGENTKVGDLTLTSQDNLSYDYDDYATSSFNRVEFADDATFDLEGKTLTSPNGAFAFVGDNLTIKNGEFVGLISSAGGRYGMHLWNDNSTKDVSTGVVVEDVKTTGICLYNTEVTLKNVTATMPDDAKYYTVYGNVYSKVTIESGTYTSGANTTALLGYCLSDSSEAGVVTEDGKNPVDGFVIKGGTFITNGKPLYLKNATHGAPVIQGGSFDIDVSSLIDSSKYQCKPNSVTGLYDVTAKL